MSIIDGLELDELRHQAKCADKFRKALQLIAAMKNMTLIAPSMGPEADNGHQVGANKAFNQAADIALDALATAPDR